MSNDHLTDIAYRHFIESVKDYAIYMLSADGTVTSVSSIAKLSNSPVYPQKTWKSPCVAGSLKGKAGGIAKTGPDSGRMS
ncbi:sensory box/GGDEF family protein [Klebsiella pneumoniae]|nr:sensory box/GGDEF family protein [Klebsiella pneumoniae]